MGEIKSFKDLKCWKACKELRLMITPVINKFPKEEKYRLFDQIVRASRSTTNNIAEGYGRFHYKENIQFCRITRGSLFELKDHFDIALEEKYINSSELKAIDEQIDTCLKLVNGYINYLGKAVGK